MKRSLPTLLAGIGGLAFAAAGLLTPAQAQAVDIRVDLNGLEVQAYDDAGQAVPFGQQTDHLSITDGAHSYVAGYYLDGFEQDFNLLPDLLSVDGVIHGQWMEGSWTPTGGQLSYQTRDDENLINEHTLTIGPGDAIDGLMYAFTGDGGWSQPIFGGHTIPKWHEQMSVSGHLILSYQPDTAGHDAFAPLQIHSMSVPEPGTLGLLALGAAVMAARRPVRRSRRHHTGGTMNQPTRFPRYAPLWIAFAGLAGALTAALGPAATPAHAASALKIQLDQMHVQAMDENKQNGFGHDQHTGQFAFGSFFGDLAQTSLRSLFDGHRDESFNQLDLSPYTVGSLSGFMGFDQGIVTGGWLELSIIEREQHAGTVTLSFAPGSGQIKQWTPLMGDPSYFVKADVVEAAITPTFGPVDAGPWADLSGQLNGEFHMKNFQPGETGAGLADFNSTIVTPVPESLALGGGLLLALGLGYLGRLRKRSSLN